jgi:hypothetical protein
MFPTDYMAEKKGFELYAMDKILVNAKSLEWLLQHR